MKTFTVTKEHLDVEGFYAGAEDLSYFKGHIEISASLGQVRFRGTLQATGHIWALAG